MCRICELRDMTKEELTAAVMPIAQKAATLEEGLTADEAMTLYAYAALLELRISSMKAQLAFSLGLSAAAVEYLSSGRLPETVSPPEPPADNGEPTGDLGGEKDAFIKRTFLDGLDK